MEEKYTIEELRDKIKEFERYIKKVSRYNKCDVYVELETFIRDRGCFNVVDTENRLIIKDYRQ